MLGTGLSYLYTKGRAIGLYPIFEDIQEEDDFDPNKQKIAINYDVTKVSPGHSSYGPNCGQFLHMIKEFY